MKLRAQILVMMVLPFFALTSLGSLRGLDNWDQLTSSQQAHADTIVSVSMVTLIHFLQVERGQSAAYLSSGGKVFVADLPASRQAVDDALSRVPASEHQLMTALGGLDETRRSVSELSLSTAQMAKYYTNAIQKMLGAVSEDLVSQNNLELSQIGSGMVSLMYAKEAAGLQRAAGASGFGGKVFTLPIYKAFVERGAKEAQLLDLTQAALERFFPDLELRGGTGFEELQNVRGEVLGAGPEGVLPNLTAPAWFSVSTLWISHLHDIEVEIAEQLGFVANEAAKAAKRDLIVTVAGVLLALLGSALLGARLLKVLSHQFSYLQSDLDKMSRKEFDFEPRHLDAKTEFGQLSRSMEHTRVALKEAEDRLLQIEKTRISDRGSVVATLELHLGRLANRNLECEINKVFPEEYERLRTCFNVTVSTLKSTISDVAEVSQSITSHASEISQTASEMSRRTESQAATLEETAAALEQQTASVRSAADGAADVDQTVERARIEATKSETVVNNAVIAMEEIEKTSDKISNITNVIDDIAFQTNLLALNAGVEAARAGSAGKGFAVVASEVQGLAQRSAEAATSIKDLINESTSEVHRGSQLVSEAGVALTAIVGQVNEISKLIGGIASGAAEQATGLTEINTGVLQMDAVTQKNAAMAEQSTAMSFVLNTEAQKLSKLMSHFLVQADPENMAFNTETEIKKAV